jgi:hypothetical protein
LRSAQSQAAFSLLILFHVRKKYFPCLPPTLFILTLLAISLGTPAMWLLRRPAIYEAAIASGQCLLLAGFWILLPVLESDQVSWPRFAAAGLFFAFAIASRVTLLGPAIVLMALVTIRIMIGKKNLKTNLGYLACLWVPLVVGGLLLLEYNFIRFGNLWEFGYRYQLTTYDYTVPGFPTFYKRNAPLNLYNYFLEPFKTMFSYPYIAPVPGKVNFTPFPWRVSPLYVCEPITGILWASPFFLCVVGLGIGEIIRRRKWKNNIPFIENSLGMDKFRIVWIAMLVTAIVACGPLLFYFYCSERFLMDFVPFLMLAATCGGWEIYSVFEKWPRWRRLILFVVAALVLWSVAANLLLGITNYGLGS